MKTAFKTHYGEIEIGDGLPCALIAEIGLNHNGSIELAKTLIEKAAYSGATFVKFQKRFPDALATQKFLDAPFTKCPSLGTNQRTVRERLELNLDEYIELKKYAENLGLIFFASAFDIPSLNFLISAGIKIIKIASHSITNGPLLNAVKESGLSVILSLGGATVSEQENAIEILKDNPLVIFHCVSSYPTPDNMCKLDTIKKLKEKYNLPVGFSSHENGIDISIAASVLGACAIERHFALDRAMIGLDQGISLEPHEFSNMAKSIKKISAARGVEMGLQDSEKQAKYSYHVAICSSEDLNQGDVLTSSNITCKQPLIDPEIYFTGLEYSELIGKKITTNHPADQPIKRSIVQ